MQHSRSEVFIYESRTTQHKEGSLLISAYPVQTENKL